jgi:hypothetical protein
MKQAKYQRAKSPKVIVYSFREGSEETKTRRSHGDIGHCLRWIGANLKEHPKIFGQAFAEYFRAGSLYKLYNEMRHPMLIRKLAEFRRQGFRVANVKPDTLFFLYPVCEKGQANRSLHITT